MKNAFAIRLTFAASLALGPIYWLPYVPFIYMTSVRAALLIALVLLVLWGNLIFERKLIFFSLAFLTASALSSAIHMDYFFLAMLPPVLMILFGSQVSARISLKEFRSAIFSSVIAFSVFCCIVLFDFLLGGVIADPFYNKYTLHLHDSGFNGGRTAWGYASNMFLALALQEGLSRSARGEEVRRIYFLPVLIIFTNIIVTGSRGAFLISLFLITMFAFSAIVRRKFLPALAVFVALFIIFFAVIASDWAAEMRIFTTFILADSRDMSTAHYRIETYRLALDSFYSNPLLGSGAITLIREGEMLQVHSVWLRLIAERGLFFFVILVAFIVITCGASAISARRIGYELRLLISAGLLTGFIEPSAVFGKYFISAVFWLPIAFFLNPTFFTQSRASKGLFSHFGTKR